MRWKSLLGFAGAMAVGFGAHELVDRRNHRERWQSEGISAEIGCSGSNIAVLTALRSGSSTDAELLLETAIGLNAAVLREWERELSGEQQDRVRKALAAIGRHPVTRTAGDVQANQVP